VGTANTLYRSRDNVHTQLASGDSSQENLRAGPQGPYGQVLYIVWGKYFPNHIPSNRDYADEHITDYEFITVSQSRTLNLHYSMNHIMHAVKTLYNRGVAGKLRNCEIDNV